MIADQPPSSITGRRLAKRARLHHTLISQTYGTVADLLADAYLGELAVYNEIDLFERQENTANFPLADQPSLWRAYTHLTLDSHEPVLQRAITRDHPVHKAVADLQARFPEMSPVEVKVIAAAWWSMQIGALVFDKPLAHGLSITLRQRDVIHEIAAARLKALILDPPLEIKAGQAPVISLPINETPSGRSREAAEGRLINAAVELLKERADAGVSGRDLAHRAGVSYGLIHHYFGSKEAVFDRAFVYLHQLYVRDMVLGSDQRLAAPFGMIGHEAFLHIWACRELAGVAMPTVDLAGMRLLLDNIIRRRGVDRRSSTALADAQADAYCSLALQLGWVLCRRNLLEILDVGEDELLSKMVKVVRWFVSRQW